MKLSRRLVFALVVIGAAVFVGSAPVDYSCTGVMQIVIQSRLQEARSQMPPERAAAFDAAASGLQQDLSRTVQHAKQDEKQFNAIQSDAEKRIAEQNPEIIRQVISDTLKDHPEIEKRYADNVIKNHPELIPGLQARDPEALKTYERLVWDGIRTDPDYRSFSSWKLQHEPAYRAKLFEETMRSPGGEDAAIKVFNRNMELHQIEGNMAQVAHAITDVPQSKAFEQLLATEQTMAGTRSGNLEHRFTAASDPFDRGVPPVVTMVDAMHAVANKSVGIKTEAELVRNHIETWAPPPDTRAAFMSDPKSRLAATVAENMARVQQDLTNVEFVKHKLKDIDLPPPPPPSGTADEKKKWIEKIEDTVTPVAKEVWTVILKTPEKPQEKP